MKKLHPKAKWIFRLQGYVLAFVVVFFLSTGIFMFSSFFSAFSVFSSLSNTQPDDFMDLIIINESESTANVFA
ncbi:MAG: hypothetical protein PWP03_245 [Candidatus Woesearchaeota archaeon]|nr:hypothetical protein [Candidatus Woesearchaeota archaeon]